jgi:hypothetical protein
MTAPSAPSKWAISIAIILGSMTTSIMDGTINVALPTMMTFLRANEDWALPRSKPAPFAYPQR